MAVEKQVELNEVDTITVKFAGDSGDGIQLTGDQFGNTTAFAGNDFAFGKSRAGRINSLSKTLQNINFKFFPITVYFIFIYIVGINYQLIYIVHVWIIICMSPA